MRKAVCVILAMLLCVVCNPAHGADLEDIRAAYSSGDYETALRELLPIARLGNAEAMVLLAEMHFFGEGTDPDTKKAIGWMTQAAVQGDTSAQFRLAVMHYLGGDVDEALKWFRTAAYQDHVHAQFSLGTMYHDGRGVSQDRATARRWYGQAARQGHAQALGTIGDMYLKDDVESQANFYAAKRGYGPSQSAIGIMYHKGNEVPQDDVKAHMWLNVGVFNGGHGKQLRDEIGKKMTIPQLREAQDLARECVRKKYKEC